ncbi:MAG TPA: DUF6670 family protein [Iamia sp.]|nr:DUF6670 family protein [Iamia sp.]
MGIGDRVVEGVLQVVGATRADEGVLPAEPVFPPHVGSRRWAWTHYGVMVPDLPDPHRFLACMAIVGTTGSRTFDTDHARVDGPRHSASLVTGTAVTAPDAAYRQYSTRYDCHLAADGSRVRLGDDLEITGSGRRRHARGRRAGLAYDLDLELTDAATWFARGPVWEHLSVLTRYAGTITAAGRTEDVAGTGTFEWARSAGVHAVLPWALPARLKAPADTFAYCVIDLDPDTQLLLSGFGIAGRPVLDAAYVRSTRGAPERHVRGVRLTVEERGPEVTTPDGRRTRPPRVLHWTSADGRLDVVVTVDTPLLYGLGSGHVGGVAHTGTLDGRAIAGQGYLEIIDRRDRPAGSPATR